MSRFVPYILDGNAAVSLLAPDGERVDQQDDELSVLRTDGNHLSIGTVRRALGRMTQTHLVQKFLSGKTERFNVTNDKVTHGQNAAARLLWF